jgi:hypothetical protein
MIDSIDVIGQLLSSETVFKALLKEAAEINNGSVTPLNERTIQRHLFSDFAILENTQFRQREVSSVLSSALKREQNKNVSTIQFGFFQTVFDDFFTVTGSEIKVSLRDTEQTEKWFRLSQKFHPFLISSYFLAKNYHDGIITINDVEVSCRSSTAFPTVTSGYLDPSIPLVDTHVHIGGAQDDSGVLSLCLRSPLPSSRLFKRLLKPDKFPVTEKKGLFSDHEIITLFALWRLIGQTLAVACQKSPSQISVTRELQRFSASPLVDIVTPLIRDVLYDCRLPVTCRHSNSALRFFREILNVASTPDLQLRSTWLLAYGCGLHSLVLAEVADSKLSRNLGLLARIQLFLWNHIRRFMVMGTGMGLTLFETYFASKARKPQSFRQRKGSLPEKYRGRRGEELLAATLSAVPLYVTGTDFVHGRIAPDKINKGYLAILNKAFQDAWDMANETRSGAFLGDSVAGNVNDRRTRKLAPLNIGVHWLKIPERRMSRLPRRGSEVVAPRNRESRKRIQKETSVLKKLIFGTHGRKNNRFKLSNARQNSWTSSRPYLLFPTTMINALDFAGVESVMPQEVVAPSIRALRKPFQRGETAPRHPKLKITIHAGEDFNHLLTGIRRIDESICLLEMEANDRIGHALAAGIAPSLWRQLVGNIVLVPKIDWLDNLVWVWSKTIDRKVSPPPTAGLLGSIEKAIAKISFDIYQTNLYLPHILHSAWLKRAEDPFKLLRKKSENNEQDLINQAYLDYHRSAEVRSRGDEMMEVETCDQWCDLLLSAQNCVVDEITTRGLIIEVCPSSNARVGGFAISDHPIFKWVPVDFTGNQNLRNFPRVTVNTDDPGIFCTSLPAEFQRLAMAARSKGFGEDQVKLWLRRFQEEAALQERHPVEPK